MRDFCQWSISNSGQCITADRSRYLRGRRLDGPHSQSGRGGKDRNPFPCANSVPNFQTTVNNFTDLALLGVINSLHEIYVWTLSIVWDIFHIHVSETGSNSVIRCKQGNGSHSVGPARKSYLRAF